MLAVDEDWTTVVRNLRQAWKNWALLMQFLEREGANVQTPGMFYVAVVQAVLLYGSET